MINRSEIMKFAWVMFRKNQNGKFPMTFSKALKKAWSMLYTKKEVKLNNENEKAARWAMTKRSGVAYYMIHEAEIVSEMNYQEGTIFQKAIRALDKIARENKLLYV